MGKTSKWLRNFLSGKKEKEKERETDKSSSNHQLHSSNGNGNPTSTPTPTPPITLPPTTPKEKRRWSFRRSSASAPGQRDGSSMDLNSSNSIGQHPFLDAENNDQRRHALAVAAATAASVIQLAAPPTGKTSSTKDAAAIKIQTFFRAYLARKALNALRGLVKLQALVRGHLVRKQATATLRCLQALINVQDRSRAQRLQMLQDSKLIDQKQFNHRKSTHENRYSHSNQEFDWGEEEHIKIVEMDSEFKASTKSRSSYSYQGQTKRSEPRISTPYAFSRPENQQISPTPSARTDMSPKTCSGHFEEYSLVTTQSSPQYSSALSKHDPSKIPFTYARSELGDPFYNEYPFYPNYMSNTESSRAKVRSHSAPKQRPETPERQPTRRKPPLEGRHVPRAIKMQRSSSHVGSAPQSYHYPWSIKLDKSNISIKASECGSNSTVLSNAHYCRFEVQQGRY